jgi:hypothetical protein
MKPILPVILLAAATPALAEETRQLSSHEHGVGTLNIAFEGNRVEMEFIAPGADIVGFEYAAETAEDRAAIDAAVAKLARPLDLFVLTEEAQCSVVQASAALESEEEHDEHHDDDHHGDDHDDHGEHDDHADHAHDDHADHGHADHDDHDDHDHDEAAHHEEDGGHTEFHAAYSLTCAEASSITEINFAYFDAFANAREIEVQMVTASGAKAFEVERDAPVLDLRGMF